ncbi:hypothetical protein LCGC14_2571650 [marine sediment metagenome]|uniref:Uncharacterized protein n=1 Tax=marine sediment metagenome TaxID=412755 RepID=A0A0F9AH23_9ZZZZ
MQEFQFLVNYTLQQIYTKFKQLSKNHETLNKNDTTLLEEIYDYLEKNYYKCYICDTTKRVIA